MRIVTLPSVFRPRSDSWLLASLVHAEARTGQRVVDLCTGSGVVAVAGAQAGADVSAVDVSRRAALTARLNAGLNRVRVDARRGDLLDAVDGMFDLISANPPYLPADEDDVPRAGARRAWDAGSDGRAVVDRICATAPGRLRPGGSVLIVQSNVCGNEETLRRLAAGGLEAEVVLRRRGEYGPLMRERLERLRSRGGLREDLGDEEEVAVIRGRRPVSAGTRPAAGRRGAAVAAAGERTPAAG